MRTIEAPQGKLDGTYVVRGIRGERVVVVVGDCSLDRISNTPRRYAVVHVDDCDDAVVVVVGKVNAKFERNPATEKAGNGIRVSKCNRARVMFADDAWVSVHAGAADAMASYAVECLDCDHAVIDGAFVHCYGTTVRGVQLTRCGLGSVIRNACIIDAFDDADGLPGRKAASIVGGHGHILGVSVQTKRPSDWRHRACGYRDETGRMIYVIEPWMESAIGCNRQVQNAILKDGRPSWADNWTPEIAATCPKALPPETE